MQKLKVNDEVIVIAGKDKGKTGEIKKINHKKKTILIAGMNIAKKAMRPTQENPNGGITEIDKPIHSSNIAVLSPKNKKATRVKIETRDGKTVRVAVSCGSVLN